jgi:uncharacterized protein YcbK (DUF882 family)
VMQAYLTVRQAEVALEQAIEDRAEALAQSRFDIAAARANAAGDEVAAAAVAIRDALYDLQHADTREESNAARAALIAARASKRDAIFQTEIEDIEFQADIGRLTIQQQIRQYQQLLRTLELNRDMRRDLRRRIAGLREEAEQASGEFDLKLGNIKLPTIYEIRRAVQSGGVGASSTTTVINNNFQIGINGAQSPAATADEFERRVNGSNRAALRSAGLRGV